ncbi:TetR/AcrR family transcriptional regulator [Cellulomonas triticagri]|uniref:TetR/AcrR family transcriptional regulator n=1 Tax=Cellulomonas triticagri TaxID=2483352 RepID=A0A3M2IMR7_9CELL|nr:TetR/AcrR family transcriptional regulator [Cellulomonas triticagri]RMI02449.1 TetR/AcrR family transcriptional regulator [Cellulomonas triticagri]
MTEQQDVAARIVAAAADLLAREGREAVTTRSVSAAAGVQPPAIYRRFGDMAGLLAAVADDGFARYLARKQAQEPSGDPVDDLRAGWDLHQEFARENPAAYVLMYGPDRSGGTAGAVARSLAILHGLVQRVAAAGRLRTTVAEAADAVHAAGLGVALERMRQPDGDVGLSERVREAVLAAVTTPDPDGATTATRDMRDLSARAVGLRAALAEADAPVTPGEAALLDELLARLSAA